MCPPAVNDRAADGRLARSAASTRQLWLRTFATNGLKTFDADGAMFRGAPPPPLPATAEPACEQLRGMGAPVKSFPCCGPTGLGWSWQVRPGSFVPATEVMIMPGGEMVTLTPTEGTACKQLNAATHGVSSASGAQVFAVKVMHVEGHNENSCVQVQAARACSRCMLGPHAQLVLDTRVCPLPHDHSRTQVMDTAGNELASARLVDVTTVRDKAESSFGPVAFGLSRAVRKPFAGMVAATRAPRIEYGTTGDVGLLVTAGGSDYALVASSWEGFHPGCAGLPGVHGTPGNKAMRTQGVKGIKGVKGVKGVGGRFVSRILPLIDGAVRGAVVKKKDDITINGPSMTIHANLRNGKIFVSHFDPEGLTPLVQNAAAVALVIGCCIHLQLCRSASQAMLDAARTGPPTAVAARGAGDAPLVLMAAAGVPDVVAAEAVADAADAVAAVDAVDAVDVAAEKVKESIGPDWF